MHIKFYLTCYLKVKLQIIFLVKVMQGWNKTHVFRQSRRV